MRPHELVKALFDQRQDIKSVSALARAIHNQGFQGTLHKFLNGQTASPDHETATRIAKFFGLPIEAIYDTKVATRIAREKGLLPAEGGSLSVDESEHRYIADPTPWPFKHVAPGDISQLSVPAKRQLERLIVAFIGGPVPHGIEADSWRQVARSLAASMDQALGKDVYSAFVLKVDELHRSETHEAQPLVVN